MKRAIITLTLSLMSIVAYAQEPLALRLEIHGRTPLHTEPVDGPGYGLLGAAVFKGEPVIATVTALNVPQSEQTTWTKTLEWRVLSDSGDTTAIEVVPSTDSTIATPHILRLKRPDARFANFRLSTFSPGRYIVELSWIDPKSGNRIKAERRRLAVYQGDEEPLIKSVYLREQARAAMAKGTSDSYQKARSFLLAAAKDSNDPSYYEELADMSAPWTSPNETLIYYERALEIAQTNLERHYGRERDWPATARALYEPQAQKVRAFRDLLEYYKTNFADVRVRVEPNGVRGQFVVERRSDGSRLRVIDPRLK